MCLSTAVFIWGSERPHTQWPGLKGVRVSGPDLLPGKLVSQRNFHIEPGVALSVWQSRRNVIPGSLICYGNRAKAKPWKNGEVIKRPFKSFRSNGPANRMQFTQQFICFMECVRVQEKTGFWGKDEDKAENINTLGPAFLTILKQWGSGMVLHSFTELLKNMNWKAVFVLVSVRAERI